MQGVFKRIYPLDYRINSDNDKNEHTTVVAGSPRENPSQSPPISSRFPFGLGEAGYAESAGQVLKKGRSSQMFRNRLLLGPLNREIAKGVLQALGVQDALAKTLEENAD